MSDTPSTVLTTPPEILLAELLDHLEMQDYPREALGPMRGFVSSMSDFLDRLRAFDLDCKEEAYTDTGALWELVGPYIDQYRPLVESETCYHPTEERRKPHLDQCLACGDLVDPPEDVS